MDSFSEITKKELLSESKIKKCCAFSFMYGFFYLSEKENEVYLLKKTNAKNADSLLKIISTIQKSKPVFYDSKKRQMRINKEFVRFSTIAEYKMNLFKCDNCAGSFLKALFLMCGSLTNPQKSYRLELVFDDENRRNSVNELLCELGFSPRIGTRQNKHILYLRDSEQIENFLILIGAVNAAFAVMNSKIYKEFVNNANRVANCDNANINKSLRANEKYIQAIEYLIDTEKINSLPEQLKETALKRIEFKELNFEQLGKQFDPPVSKSGIYHRLERILAVYKELTDEQK